MTILERKAKQNQWKQDQDSFFVGNKQESQKLYPATIPSTAQQKQSLTMTGTPRQNRAREQITVEPMPQSREQVGRKTSTTMMLRHGPKKDLDSKNSFDVKTQKKV